MPSLAPGTKPPTFDAVHGALKAAWRAHPHCKCYLLTDPSVLPSSARTVPWAQRTAYRHSPVPLDHPAIGLPARPVLTFLASDGRCDDAAIAESVAQALAELEPDRLLGGEGREIGGWLFSQATQEAVACHLAAVMIARNDRGVTVWLRLQDPAVRWALGAVLQPNQTAALLGVIEADCLVTPAGALSCIAPRPLLFTPAPTPTLQFSAEQWRGIESIAPLTLMLRNDRQHGSSEPLSDARTVAMNAIRRGSRWGFVDRDDLALYGHLAVTVHPDFDAHRWVRERLQQRAPDDFLSGLIAHLTPADWQRIAQDLASSAAAPAPASPSTRNFQT